MITYIFLYILFSVGLFVIFKFFPKFYVDNLTAITVNYFVAALMGVLTSSSHITIFKISDSEWFVPGVLLGGLFISLFLLIAKSTQQFGVSVTTVANKMAVVIPVFIGFFIHRDEVVWYKVLGIMLALGSIYLSTKQSKSGTEVKKYSNILIPLILFIGGGVLDASLHWVQTLYVPEQEASWFSTLIFLSAGIIGSFILLWNIYHNKIQLNVRSVIAGVVLGIPNYFSIYFLLKAIDTEILDSSVLFPVANIGGVTLAAMVGLFLFKEKLSKMNWFGVGLAVIATALIIFDKLI